MLWLHVALLCLALSYGNGKINMSQLKSLHFTPGLQSAVRCGGFMVHVHISALHSRSSSLGFSSGRGHHVVLIGKTLNCHGAFLHPHVQMGTGELNVGDNPAMD